MTYTAYPALRLSRKPGVTAISIRILVSLLMLAGVSVAPAATVSVALDELANALGAIESEPDALQQLVLRKIQTRLDQADLAFESGELLFEDTVVNVTADTGCNRTEVRSLTTRMVLTGNTRLQLSLDSLHEPIEITLDVKARILADGRAKQVVGFRLGGCQELGIDNFSFTASGPASFKLRLTLRLNPVLDRVSQQLVLRPTIALAGELYERNIVVDVDDSLLRNVLEHILEDQLDDTLDNSRFLDVLDDLQEKIQSVLDRELEDGLVTIDLPTPSNEQVMALYDLLSPAGDFTLSLGYLNVRRQELLAALILGDDEGLNTLLGNAALCEAAGLLQAPLLHEPVFRVGNKGCEATQIAGVEQLLQSSTWFSDSSCQRPIEFRATSTIDYCNTVLDRQRLGNAAADPDQLGLWTLSPGTRFDIGAVPLEGKQQPFTQRIDYKTIATPMGECRLEMRIHSARVDSTGTPKRVLLALHGGSWQHRSSGAVGIESMATQFVNAGYVVFAPFYRLIGTSEANAECNDTSLDEIMEDANDALTWVLDHSEDYGAVGAPVVFGQSAGGHLAASLAIERPAEVASAVLFYAPVDFGDFARGIQSGIIDSASGQRILEAVLGVTVDGLDLSAPIILRNSYPDRVITTPGNYPPFFLLHGRQDSVLPYQQSVRLCSALSAASIGAVTSEPSGLLAESRDDYRDVFSCDGQGSELHLINEGEHALDFCVAEELCLAGGEQSAERTRDSVERMLVWMDEVNLTEATREPIAFADLPAADGIAIGGGAAADFPLTTTSPDGGGATAWYWWIFLAPVWLVRSLRKVSTRHWARHFTRAMPG